MPQQQFASTTFHPGKLTDASKYYHLGQIEIKDVFYTIEHDGLIQIKALTNHPTWSQLLSEKKPIKPDDCVIIVLDVEELVVGDKYEIYLLKDVQDEELRKLDDEYILSGQDKKKTHVLRWKLASRLASAPTNLSRSMISITYLPVNCPICGVPIDIDETSGELVCVNPECRVHKYLSVNRFLTVACHLPQYQRFSRVLIDHDVINTSADLFEIINNKKDLYGFGRKDYVNGFIRDLSEVKGKLHLTDWINALPNIKHDFLMVEKPPTNKPHWGFRNYLCTTTTNSDFGSAPMSLIDWLDEKFSDFALYETANEYSDWRELHTKEISKYMSVPVFFNLAQLLLGADTEKDHPIEILNKLFRLGVFPSGYVDTPEVWHPSMSKKK